MATKWFLFGFSSNIGNSALEKDSTSTSSTYYISGHYTLDFVNEGG